MRDIVLVARFELLRAVRTRRAVALFVLFGVATGGGAWLFTKFVGVLENQVAKQLGVAETRVPGTMLAELVRSELWRDVLGGMTGATHLVDHLVQIPPLALFNLWFGFLILPLFAASASAECIAVDVQTRAIRYEAQRTGRLDLVLGRFLGQLVLTAGATFGSILVVFVVGQWFMVGTGAVSLAGWLLWFGPRNWLFAVPFVGIGVAASQVTASPAWARVMAVALSGLSWVAFGLCGWAQSEGRFVVAADAMLQVLPQGWLRGLWEPGPDWLLSGTACLALGAAVVAVGYVRFSSRDL